MLLSSVFLSVVPLAGLAVASPVGARDTHPLCNADCMAAYEAGYQAESALWVNPDFASDPFYKTPANATGARPGDLLKWEDIPWQLLRTNWTRVPGGMSLSRMLYMSEDVHRNPIPASAFILTPYSTLTVQSQGGGPAQQQPTKFKTLAWAHGTTGHGPQCAPSNSQNLGYGWAAPLWFASLGGYAVIATDYAGMGTDIPTGFQYEAGWLHAADVAYSVVAARKVIGHLLTDEWAVVGHSEGGMTAWRTNERLGTPESQGGLSSSCAGAGKFLGSVAASPALRPAELIPRSFEIAGDGPLGAPVSIYVLQSVSKLYPELALDKYLTPGMLDLLPLLDRGCLDSAIPLVGNLTVDQIYKDRSWVTAPAFAQDWQTRVNGAGPHRLAAPMLVLQGKNDTLTYPENCIRDFERTCTAFPESSAELVLVPGLDHTGSFFASQPYYRSWLEKLFAGHGQGFEKGCKKTEIEPWNPNFNRGEGGY